MNIKTTPSKIPNVMIPSMIHKTTKCPEQQASPSSFCKLFREKKREKKINQEYDNFFFREIENFLWTSPIFLRHGMWLLPMEIFGRIIIGKSRTAFGVAHR